MTDNQRTNLELMEGRKFILGREGHIYIDSPTASKHHAEIRIRGAKIFLRDLNSTNGTYLLKDRKLVRFQEGYVELTEVVVIGKHSYRIRDLLDIASNFVVIDDNKTQTDLPGSWKKRLGKDDPVPGKTG